MDKRHWIAIMNKANWWCTLLFIPVLLLLQYQNIFSLCNEHQYGYKFEECVTIKIKAIQHWHGQSRLFSSLTDLLGNFTCLTIHVSVMIKKFKCKQLGLIRFIFLDFNQINFVLYIGATFNYRIPFRLSVFTLSSLLEWFDLRIEPELNVIREERGEVFTTRKYGVVTIWNSPFMKI